MRVLVPSQEAYQSRVADQLSRKPQERLFKVVVGFRGDVVVLEVLFAVEDDRFRLDFPLLHINFVADEDDGDVLANANQITLTASGIMKYVSRCMLYSRCQFGTFL